VNSYQNHKQSKKHKDLEQAYMNEKNLNSSQDDDLKAVKSDKAQKRKEQIEQLLKQQQIKTTSPRSPRRRRRNVG